VELKPLSRLEMSVVPLLKFCVLHIKTPSTFTNFSRFYVETTPYERAVCYWLSLGYADRRQYL
jgi:hypothetical protein